MISCLWIFLYENERIMHIICQSSWKINVTSVYNRMYPVLCCRCRCHCCCALVDDIDDDDDDDYDDDDYNGAHI